MIFLITHLPIAGIAYAIKESNLSGKVIVVLLFMGSMIAWSVMVSKAREMGHAKKVGRRFLSAYRKEAHPVSVFLKRQKYTGCPTYKIYDRTCMALGGVLESRGAEPEDLFMGGVGTSQKTLSELQMSAVRNVAERELADQVLLLENNMGILATATTTAPFLGLLGTVWGVMEAFGGMASAGGSSLSEVAPGISGALLTTVVGLLVALPSAVGYNILSDIIRRVTVEMDNFSQEMVSDMERHYLSH